MNDEKDPRLISGGYWDEDPKFPSKDWQYEVACGYTRRGYWTWVEAMQLQKEQDDSD